MQSDTVIGIVGAVVLVAVMVGVFAYEYNNTPDIDTDDDDSDAAKMAAFNETYGLLAATEDLDADGVPNYLDMDMDGDGINNTEDETIAVTFYFNGTAAANTNPAGNGPASSFEFFVGTGATHTHITLMYTIDAIGGALPGQERLGMDATDMGTATDSDADGVLELMSTDLAGDITLNVYQTQLNNGGEAFTSMITIEY